VFCTAHLNHLLCYGTIEIITVLLLLLLKESRNILFHNRQTMTNLTSIVSEGD